VPLLDSPRFSLRDVAFDEIDRKIGEVGHVVLTDVWNPRYLQRLQERVERKFKADDQAYEGRFDEFPDGVIDNYLGSHANLELLPDWTTEQGRQEAHAFDDEFYTELARSGLPALFRYLLSGDFVASRTERVIRRADPAFPARFTGLHRDGQLRSCSTRGLHSDREFTIWSPLQACVEDDIPRLLLLHRGEGHEDLFREDEQIEVESKRYLPVELRPVQPRDEAAYLEQVGDSIHPFFDRVFAARRCYAPPVPLGSVVLFEHNTDHGTYWRPAMTRPRYSVDFRVVGEYQRDRANWKYDGMIYRTARFPEAVMPGFHPLRRWPWLRPYVSPFLGVISRWVRS
jgi:hypothetical protein